jgi:hypothetical protein
MEILSLTPLHFSEVKSFPLKLPVHYTTACLATFPILAVKRKQNGALKKMNNTVPQFNCTVLDHEVELALASLGGQGNNAGNVGLANLLLLFLETLGRLMKSLFCYVTMQ